MSECEDKVLGYSDCQSRINRNELKPEQKCDACKGRTFQDMSDAERVEVLMQNDRSRLLRDCRTMGISAHRIKDHRALCTMMVGVIRKINAKHVAA